MTIFNKLAAERGTLLDETENPGSCLSRRSLLTQPHIAGLEAWANGVAAKRSESIPSFDPSSGGVNARALFLLQDPSRAASEGSRFVSIDNNDQTAHNCSKAYLETGLDYASVLHWNVVPWWVHNPTKARPGRTLASEARRAHSDLLDLLNQLPDLEVVVLLGKQAQAAWRQSGVDLVRVLRCPHTGSLAWNRRDLASGRMNRDLTVGTFAEVADLLAPRRSASGHRTPPNVKGDI